MKGFKRVFIGVPTYSGKNYCRKKFVENLTQLTYPKELIEILVVDNSDDQNENYNWYKNQGFNVHKMEGSYINVYDKLAQSHNFLRNQFLQSNCHFFLHLESDVFPQHDIIEQLIWSRKKVISPMYYLSGGANRHLVQRNRQWDGLHRNEFSWGYNYGHFVQSFVDGTIKRVLTNGLGCILLHRSIIEQVKFRFKENHDAAPDSLFAEDLLRKGIKVFCHTALHAYHWNSDDWGNYHSLMQHKHEFKNNHK